MTTALKASMHPEIMEWVNFALRYYQDTPGSPAYGLLHVLDVGSYDMNGTARGRFNHIYPTIYFGIDIAPGPGVDALAYGWHLPAKPESFDVALCLQVLEHCNRKAAVLNEMHRCLRPGGLCIVTCAGPGYPPHDGRTDYYRPMAGSTLLAELSRMYRSCGVACEPNSLGYPDVKAWGIK